MKDLKLSDKNDESTQQEKKEVKNEEPKELPREWRYAKHHPREQIIGDTSKGVYIELHFNILQILLLYLK